MLKTEHSVSKVHPSPWWRFKFRKPFWLRPCGSFAHDKSHGERDNDASYFGEAHHPSSDSRLVSMMIWR
jgi:hypothetical protein